MSIYHQLFDGLLHDLFFKRLPSFHEMPTGLVTLLAQEVVSLGPGVRGAAVIIRTDDLRKALGVFETGCFVECEE